ncbi:MAG: hypothetical protein KGL38_09410, partial [Gemmatimonadota bacterium]|nr:hypothetical protein [Gemmatimonadota bacterium]
MDATGRKWTGRAIQALLVVAVLAYVGNWARVHLMRTRSNLHVSGVTTLPDSLGPGDVRIYNADSSLDVVLIGDKIAAGLSPKTIAKVRADIASKQTSDSGLGGSISKLVTGAVENNIGMQAEFPLRDVRDIRWDNGRLLVDWKKGTDHTLF